MLEKNTIDLLGKGVALAGFLFTVGTYAYGQYVGREEARYQKSIAMIDDYRAEGIRQLEEGLNTRLLAYNDEDFSLNNHDHYDLETFDAIAKDVFFGFDGEVGPPDSGIEPYADEILTIADFYARVEFCAAAEICDQEILNRYFCPRAVSFADRNERLLSWYSTYSDMEAWNNGLATLVGTCR